MGAGGRVARIGRVLAGRAAHAVRGCVTAALVLVAVAVSLGRCRAVPVTPADGSALRRGDLAFAVPAHAASVRVGDEVVLRVPGEGVRVRRVAAVLDAVHGRVRFTADLGTVAGAAGAAGAGGRSGAGAARDDVHVLPSTVWRVTLAAPLAGRVLGLVDAPVPAVLLVLAGLRLIGGRPPRRASIAA